MREILARVITCLVLCPTLAWGQAGAGGAPSTHPVVTAGNFTFRLSGCRAGSVTVDCDIAIENRTADDLTIRVFSRFISGVQDVRLRALGVSTMIDDAGKTYEVETLRLANQDGAPNGQSTFQIFAGTHPVLSLHFENVGLRG